MQKAFIAASAFYVPERRVDNQYFNDLYKTDIDTFLRQKRNILTRYFMDQNQATSDLIVPAVEQALARAKLSKDDVDLLVVATDTPDYLSPSTAAVVQHKLGLRRAGTFDLNAACAGFVTALDMAGKYIVADQRYNNIVVVGAYGMSKFLNWKDYKIASLFADGAGAVVLQRAKPEQTAGILAAQLFTDGQYHDYMGLYGGGTFMPVNQAVIERDDHLLRFAKKIPLDTNSVHWPRLIHSVLDCSQRQLKDVKAFFLTQLNITTINETMDSLGVDRKLSHNIMDRFGYTGSACIPMALADACEQGKLKKGDLVMFVGSGGGLAMAALAMEWGFDT
jgi:3-oxoacyl-[acyl-carrier-protein] synthase-3